MVLANVVFLRPSNGKQMGAIDLALENVAERRMNDYFVYFLSISEKTPNPQIIGQTHEYIG